MLSQVLRLRALFEFPALRVDLDDRTWAPAIFISPMKIQRRNKCMAVWNILECAMGLPNNFNQPKSPTGIQYPVPSDPDVPGRDEYTISDAAAHWSTRRKGDKPLRCECASCAYYEPERAYCTYIHTPVDILFMCPQILERRH